jgi:endonuclease YncB( thermonuclease family)
LIALIALAAAFGGNRLPDTSRLTDPGNVIHAPGEPTATSQTVAQEIPTETSTLPLIDTNDPTRSAAETAAALGVGGETAEPTDDTPSDTPTREATATATNTVEPTATRTPAPEPTATDEPTIAAADDPTEEPAPEPTGTPTPEPTETAEPTATDTPTPEPTLTHTATLEPTATDTATLEPTATHTPTIEPTATETATPEPTATETPTEEPIIGPPAPETETPTAESMATATETATFAPSDTPTATETATDVPTETPTEAPTATNTAEPTETETATPEPTPTPGFPMQGRTVAGDENPDQVFSTGAFRYTVEYAERAVEIPNLELPALADGREWVVVVLYAQNWSTEAATLNMADFQLLASGNFGWQFIGMDNASPDISRFLGFDPILETTELASIPEGEGIRLALVYLIPPTTTDIELIDDTSGLNISQSLAKGGDVTNLGRAPERPELLEVTVTEVIDGRTIVVESEGETATIQYLGIDVPTGNECYAAESTLTNSNIVLGQTVYLEREARNRVVNGEDVFARDVWIDNSQGGLVLVSAWLASEGAAVPAPANQDTRFAGWIQAAADAAHGNVAGFWAVCGGPPIAPGQGFTSDVAQTNPINRPTVPLLTFGG